MDDTDRPEPAEQPDPAARPEPSDGQTPGSPRSGAPRWLKALVLTGLVAVGIVVLFTWVFPWVEERMQDPTIGAPIAVTGSVVPER